VAPTRQNHDASKLTSGVPLGLAKLFTVQE
jgi:hypothetical protein